MSSKTSLRQKRFRVKIVLAGWAAIVVLAYSGHFPQPMIAKEGMQAQTEAGDTECVSYCSATRPGTVLMEVRIRLADRSLSEADLRSKTRQQQLEVTVYSEGFERGLYATLSAIKPKARFRVRTRGDGLAPAVQAQLKIPSLEKLVITDVATRLDKSAQSFLLMQTDLVMQHPPATATAEWVTVRVEGVESGMNYTFRLRGGGSVVTCEAEECPVDMIPAPATRTKRNLKTSH